MKGTASIDVRYSLEISDSPLGGFPFFTIFTYANSSYVPKLRVITGWIAGLCLLIAGFTARAQPLHGVAFYDVDGLYDTVPSPFGNDTRFLPRGQMRWTDERYGRKVAQTAAVIDSLGLPLVCLYGVENESVVRDVVGACKGDYAYLFRTTDSYNGLDFALLYFGDRFFPDRVDAGHFWMTAAGELRGAGRVCLLMSSSDRYIGYKVEEHRRLRGCRTAAQRVVRASCGGATGRTGYAACGQQVGDAQQCADRYGVPYRTRRCLRPPLVVLCVGRSAVGDLYPPAVRRRAGC